MIGLDLSVLYHERKCSGASLSLHVTTRDAATKLWIGIIEKEISEQVV
jgi:hypothetical protein